MAKNNFLLFSGSGNRKLALDIANILKKPLGKMEIVTFADSEKRVRIEEKVADRICFVIASLSNPVDTHLVELCLIADALKTNDCGKLVAVIPYFGYARQDKAHREGEGISARVMAHLIEAVDFNKVVAVDLHSDFIEGFFDIGLKHLSAAELFAQNLGKTKKDMVVVSPDAGAAKRSQKFADLLDAPLTFIEKKRNLDKAHTIDHLRLVGDVTGKTAVMIDDVITSGGTLVKAAYMLKDHGAKEVIAAATHADFVNGTKKILEDSPLDRVYVTDSIVIKPEDKFKNLEILSLAPLLAEQIRKMIQ